MFYDYGKNDYHYLNNAKTWVWEIPKDLGFDGLPSFEIPTRVRDVLDMLSAKRPLWKFKSDKRPISIDKERRLQDFDVYQGDEKLGRIWVEYPNSATDSIYYAANFRIQATRRRGGDMSSKDVKRMVAACVKHFHPRDTAELARELWNSTSQSAKRILSDAPFRLMSAKYRLDDALLAYAATNWDVVKAALPLPMQDTDLPDIYNRAQAAQKALAVFGTEKHGTVVKQEATDSYFVIRASDKTSRRYTSDTLPPNLRSIMGMLKLVTPGKFVADIGLRVDDHTFVCLTDVDFTPTQEGTPE